MYSDFFEFNNPGFYELYCTSTTNSSDILYFRVKINVKEEIHYLQLNEIKKQNLTKLIKNNTRYEIEIRSSASKQEPPQIIKSGESIHYAQCHPMIAGSELKVTLVNRDEVSLSFIVDVMIINTEAQLFEIDKDHLIKMTTRFVGANTVLEISTLNKADIRQRNLHMQESSVILQCGINGISLSVMRLHEKKTREEFINLVFYRITAGLDIKSWSEMTFIGSIDDFQIDNNSVESTNFPVILRNFKTPGIPEDRSKFLQWHVVMENPTKSSHWYFSKVELKIAMMEAFIEEEYIDQILSFGKSLAKLISSQADRSVLECITRKYYDDLLTIPDQFRMDKKVWELSTLSENNDSVYIDYMHITPINLILSYFQDASSTIDKDFELFSLVGVVLGGFEEAPIKIKEVTHE